MQSKGTQKHKRADRSYRFALPLQEVSAEEGASPPSWTSNAKLGRFTNFVNLLDMCGLSLPSGVIMLDAVAAAEEVRGGKGCEGNVKVVCRLLMIERAASPCLRLFFFLVHRSLSATAQAHAPSLFSLSTHRLRLPCKQASVAPRKLLPCVIAHSILPRQVPHVSCCPLVSHC